MKHFRPLTVVLLFWCSLTTSWAQPPLKYGCHYVHNKGPVKWEMTPQQKNQIDETIARSDTFDILNYDITLDVTDYAGQTITAATTITYTPKMAGLTFIRFDLFQLVVDSVVDANGALAFTYDDQFMQVALAAVPVLGSNYEMTVYYHGSPHHDPVWGGVYFESNMIYNLGIGLTTIPPNFGKVLYPCFDSFVERATYGWHVTSAGGRSFHGQGQLVGETMLGGDTIRRDFIMTDAITTHVSAFAVSNYIDSSWVHNGAYGPVPITLSAQPAVINTMVNKFADLGGAIDALEFWYGPQPYERVGYVHTTDGAMEHVTNVAYNAAYMNTQSLANNQDLYSHELGHNWWGSHVTQRVHNDMWLKEGPAEYSSHLVEEWVHGHDAFIKKVKDNHLAVLKTAHLNDGGFWPLSPMPDAHIYGDHTYYKGASVMHNLRGYLGDTLFRQAMSGAQTLLANTDITPTDLRDALESASGVDLHPFFDDQVFDPGFSVWVIDQVDPGGIPGNYEVSLRQRLRECPDWYTQVPLDITFIGADGATNEHLVMASDELPPTLSLSCPFTPVMTVIDRHDRLNMARMDHEFTLYPGIVHTSFLPYVDLRVDDVNVPDTAMVRIEHIWAGPLADNLGWGISAVSSTHYWKVDGLWPVGLVLNGRAYYDAQVATDLDFDLYGTTEADALLAYRATPLDAWEIYPHSTVTSGNLLDGTGFMVMDTLLKGEYAFAAGSAIAGVNEGAQAQGSLGVFPNPATDHVTITGEANGTEIVLIDLLAADGRLLQRTQAKVSGEFSRDIDVSGLSNGDYLVEVSGINGHRISKAGFEVLR